MGLNAAVWPNPSRVNLGANRHHAKVDPITGQLYFENADLEKRLQQELRPLLKHRVGNIMAVAALRAEATQLVGEESRMVQQVLYSGAHAGDCIAVEELGGFRKEMDVMRRSGRMSRAMGEFLCQMDELIEASLRENNPIVFI